MKTSVFSFAIIILFSIKTFSFDLDNSYAIILSKYVENGFVDYDNLKNDKELNNYIEILINTNPDTLSNRNAKLAFWINAYNAYTLKVIVDNYPIESINDLNWGGLAIAQLLNKTIWQKDIVVINHKKISLDDIEHGIIRKEFKDPRIHFALVCGALSCPELRNGPYKAEKLNDQLNDQAIKFINNKNKNYFDFKNKTAHLSQYFNWYEDDFGSNDNEILKYISKYIYDKEISKLLLENSNEWKIKFIPYNWCLNKQNPDPDGRCVTDWDSVEEWFFGLGKKYNVNPLIFGGIYIGAIPFFTLSLAWFIRNYRKSKSIVLPALFAGFFFISAYLYLIIAGRNVPWWVYVFLILMILYGVYSTIKKVRKKVRAK